MPKYASENLQASYPALPAGEKFFLVEYGRRAICLSPEEVWTFSALWDMLKQFSPAGSSRPHDEVCIDFNEFLAWAMERIQADIREAS